jgi:hypothetical protein
MTSLQHNLNIEYILFFEILWLDTKLHVISFTLLFLNVNSSAVDCLQLHSWQ